MISIAVVDSGPLVAVANRADPDHERCLEILQDASLRLVIPALCVAEVSYLLGSRMGSRVEARFLRGLEELDVRAPKSGDWARIEELVREYSNFPLGGIDASVAALAESLDTDLIVTLDHRHFAAMRRTDGTPFRLLPTL